MASSTLGEVINDAAKEEIIIEEEKIN